MQAQVKSGATERMIGGFAAIIMENKALVSYGIQPLDDQAIKDRMETLSAVIKETTGFVYEVPELLVLYRSYKGGE